MQGTAQGEPEGGTGGLAHLLLNSYQEHLIQNRLQEEQEREEGAQEEEDDDEGDGKTVMSGAPPLACSGCSPVSSISHQTSLAVDDVVQQQAEEPTPEEKALLREEFVSQMHQRFLDGKDKDFNYRSATLTLCNDLFVLHRLCQCNSKLRVS